MHSIGVSSNKQHKLTVAAVSEKKKRIDSCLRYPDLFCLTRSKPSTISQCRANQQRDLTYRKNLMTGSLKGWLNCCRSYIFPASDLSIKYSILDWEKDGMFLVISACRFGIEHDLEFFSFFSLIIKENPKSQWCTVRNSVGNWPTFLPFST